MDKSTKSNICLLGQLGFCLILEDHTLPKYHKQLSFERACLSKEMLTIHVLQLIINSGETGKTVKLIRLVEIETDKKE